MTRPKRTVARIALALTVVAALVLSACTTIPRSGPIEQGGSVKSQGNGFGPVDYLPAGPVKNATPKEILRGFVDAAVSPQNGYAVAQEFLTTKFANTWNPDATVTVDTSIDRRYDSVDTNHVRLSVSPLAQVDAAGNYLRASSSTVHELAYSFQKVGGQWRISKGPDGVVIDSPRFTDVFSAHTLYFYSPDYAYLVPDERWFPSRPSTQTRIVKALLAGPAKWLVGAVLTAFPTGTQLTADSVPVSSGQAEVPLNNAVSSASQLTLQRIKLQLTQSLVSISSITGVTITINGVERSISALGAEQPLQDPVDDLNPLIMKDGKFGFLSANAIVPVANISDKVAALAPSAVTLSADRLGAAALNAHGVYLVRSNVDAPKLVDDRSGLIPPTLDNDGYVWSVTQDAPNEVRVAAADGSSSAVAADWPGASDIRSLVLSRDGTRVAALVTVAGHAHIMAAGVIRTAEHAPDHLGAAVDFGAVSGANARSLAWLGDLSVAALSTDAQGGTTLSSQVLGGELTETPGPDGGVVLASGSAVPQYWVLTQAQSLQQPRGTSWEQKTDAVTLLATQTGTPAG